MNLIVLSYAANQRLAQRSRDNQMYMGMFSDTPKELCW